MKEVGAVRHLSNRKMIFFALIGILVALMVALVLHSHSVSERKARRAKLPRFLPIVQVHDLGGASSLTLFTPALSKKTIVIAVPAKTDLMNKSLRKLSFDASVTIVKIEILPTDCQQMHRIFDDALHRFAPKVDVVVGLDQEAELAQRWLSLEQRDNAIAVSFTTDSFELRGSRGCNDPTAVLPMKGVWHNITSSKLTALESGVSTDLNTPRTSGSLISGGLEMYVRHNILNIPEVSILKRLPLVEMPVADSDTLAILYSGDGGWREVDKKFSGKIAEQGFSVVGVDTLEDYWDFKSPEDSALELSEIMAHYRQVWGIKHFVIGGYSFGADVLPALYNRLPMADQADIESIVLLSFARNASFEIRLEGLVGKDVGKSMTGPEMALLPSKKVLCVYGLEESRKTGCTDSTVVGTVLALPGDHHFNGDYDALSSKVIDFLTRPSRR